MIDSDVADYWLLMTWKMNDSFNPNYPGIPSKDIITKQTQRVILDRWNEGPKKMLVYFIPMEQPSLVNFSRSVNLDSDYIHAVKSGNTLDTFNVVLATDMILNTKENTLNFYVLMKVNNEVIAVLTKEINVEIVILNDLQKVRKV